MHYVDLLSWTNVSNKHLKALILTTNILSSLFVAWMGSEKNFVPLGLPQKEMQLFMSPVTGTSL
jgi:hypothetical protein